MKFRMIILLAGLVFVAACSKKSAPPMPFEKTSEEYTFFEGLAETAPVVSPVVNTELVSTKGFSIYSGQVLPFIYPRLKGQSQRGAINEQAVNQLVQSAAVYLAEKQLLVENAMDSGIKVSQDSINAELDKIYSQSGGEEQFLEKIKAQGLTKEYFLQDVSESMVIRKFLDEVVYPKVDPTEQDLIDDYNKDTRATVRHILLTTTGKSDDEKAEIRKKMEGILERARAGEDFAELAKEYTEDPGSKENGGLYENFPRGQMVKPFEDASFDLAVGSISDIVETQYGFHIIKVVSREREDLPFEQVKDSIARRMEKSNRRNAEVDLVKQLKIDNDYTELFSAE